MMKKCLAVLSALAIATSSSPAARGAQSPVPVTGQTVEYAAGDDGSLQRGLPWPEPRFTDHGDGTATDHLTGLVWFTNPEVFGNEMTWRDSLAACAELADGQHGLSDGSAAGDWRLPTVKELTSLLNLGRTGPALPEGHPFVNVTVGTFWSSTSYAGGYRGHAWYVSLFNGMHAFADSQGSNRVLPVRDTRHPAESPVPVTGQTTEFATGDDGDLQRGAPWPEPRFTDHGDGTATDRLTGLVWFTNPQAIGQMTWRASLAVCAELADGQHGLSDGSAAGDWRLPNFKELHSLIQYGRTAPSLPEDHPFGDLVRGTFWSSTTYAGSGFPGHAWYVSLFNNFTFFAASGEEDVNFVLPVRNAKP